MSLVCGMYLLRSGAAFPPGWAEHLRKHVSRRGSGSVSEFSDERLFLLKLDLGAFDAPAWSVGERRVTTISGDAIVCDDPVVRGRADDMAAFEGLDVARLQPLLVGARGYYNLVHYDRTDHRLAIAVDRVGVRLMYVYQDRDLLVFAGALRLIENLPGVRLTTDVQGVMEAAAFGVPFGTRTRYKEVMCMSGGSQLLFDNGQATTDRYWKFDRNACTEVTEDVDATLDRLYAQFQKAVRLRVGRRKGVFSALSGGLDSRCVTTELWRLGLEVHSLNISWKRSQDDVFGGAYAARLGLTHHHVERPLEEAGNSLAQRLQQLMADKAALCVDLPSTARQMWSGNGGSLGLGHAKMSPEVTKRFAAGDSPGAVREFLRAYRCNLSGALLRGDIVQWAENLPFERLMAELSRISCSEPARAMFIVQLENNQHRLLAFHLEQIDLVPVEFIEPLFDPEMLSIVCKLPMAFCLRHHMYHRWLERFPPEILSVAWQVYPGHEPCPVVPPAGAFDQWKPPRRIGRGSLIKPTLRAAVDYLRHRSRFQGLLRTERVLGAYLARGLELRDTSHLLRQVDLLAPALAASEGRMDVPDGVRSAR